MTYAANSGEPVPKRGLPWRQLVVSLYPDALTSTYCVPPMHFNRVPLGRRQVPGTTQQAFLIQSRSDPETKAKKGRKKKQFLPASAPQSQQASGWSESRDLVRQAVETNTSSRSEDLPTSLWTIEKGGCSDYPDQHVLESNVQDDLAQNHVLLNLQKLGEEEGEVMFIVSHLKFTDYLNKADSWPGDLDHLPKFQKKSNQDQGSDFDFIIINRRWGVLTAELKSLGLNPDGGYDIEERPDTVLVKRLEKSRVQLEKSTETLRHFLGDIEGLEVKKALFLPYVKADQLQRVLSASENRTLNEGLVKVLGPTQGLDVIDYCCCHDHLSDPKSYWDVTRNLCKLKAWWRRLVPRAASGQCLLSDEIYLDIVARFVGPATSVVVHSNMGPRVEVRTAGEAVSVLGQRLARLVLTPQQLDILHRAPAQVCLTGPPGTGKTLMLVLMGLIWLQAGHDVYVVSTYGGSLAVSYLIQHQLNLTSTAMASTDRTFSPGCVYLKYYEIMEGQPTVDGAVRELASAAAHNNGQLHILVDEVKFTTSDISGPQTRLVKGINAAVKNAHIWTVCLGNLSIPEELESIPLTVPLRCAPVLQREIHSAISTFKINEFTTKGVTAPGDGMNVERIIHQGDGHDVQWPLDCIKCGLEVANALRRYGVGTMGTGFVDSPQPLKYKDVFVLTRSHTLTDIVRDAGGKERRAASGLVTGLRQADLPVHVIKNTPLPGAEKEWMTDLEDVATARSDRVTVSHHIHVSGLERKLLVWVLGLYRDHEEGVDAHRIDARDRLYVVSRGTTQLLKVDVP